MPVSHFLSGLDDIRQVDLKTLAGKRSYTLAKDLFNVKTMDQAFIWINKLSAWRMTYSDFLREMTIDGLEKKRSTHELRLFAESSLWRLD